MVDRSIRFGGSYKPTNITGWALPGGKMVGKMMETWWKMLEKRWKHGDFASRDGEVYVMYDSEHIYIYIHTYTYRYTYTYIYIHIHTLH